MKFWWMLSNYKQQKSGSGNKGIQRIGASTSGDLEKSHVLGGSFNGGVSFPQVLVV